MRRMIGNFAALAMAGVVSFGFGEVALRAVVTLPLPRTEPEVRYLPHPNRRFTLQPSQSAFTYGAPITVDDRGFRLNGEATRRAEAPTVLALGDSFTFGLGVKDNETWPARLEQRLVEAGRPRVRVINAGTISYGTFQQMDLLKEHGLDCRPEVVVHALYWNDFMNDNPPGPDDPRPLTSDGYFIWDRPPDTRGMLRKGASWLFSRSALLFATRQAAARYLSSTDGGSGEYSNAYQRMLRGGLSPEEWQPIENFYRQLQTIGGEQGFSVLAVIMPVIDIVSQTGGDQHPYLVEARKRLTALGLPFVDAFRAWSGNQEPRADFLPQGPDAHLNAEGYRRVGDAVASVIMATPDIWKRLQP